jgi:hypothetical protein
MHRSEAQDAWVLAGALGLIALRLVLSSDLSVQIAYSPHDDSLYVERAQYVLRGEGFGPYDSRILVKYPGLSLWLAAMHTLGVPFLFSVNVVYVAAGLYMAFAMLRCRVPRLLIVGALAFYLLNPICFGYVWIKVLREPLGTGLFVLILAAMMHIFRAAEEARPTWNHLAVLSVAFAFSLFLREDDRLLWGLLALFGAMLAWRVRHAVPRKAVILVAAAVLAPGALAKGYEYSLRSFIERHYGLPIIYELSEGEYPRLLAAIRSIDTSKDNRMVMATQETLARLRTEVPAFRPVIDRLPPAGPRTLSCRIHGVCTEWSNGWMPFWIRDEAYRAGLTPSLVAAQDYYRRVRETIEERCREGRFACTPKGKGLVPPMELRWTRAYVAEAWRLIKMAFAPDPNTVAVPSRTYDVTPELASVYQAVTLTRYASTGWDPTAREEISPSVLPALRLGEAGVFRGLAVALLFFALSAFVYRLASSKPRPLTAFGATATVFGLYWLLRLAALSYVAVYMGAFDSRMVFSLYTAGIFLALPFAAETYALFRGKAD